MSQQKPDDHIEIEIKLDEIDTTSAEAWNIERENYNKPKSENSRQPGTTPEKEKAITEALKHFKMI